MSQVTIPKSPYQRRQRRRKRQVRPFETNPDAKRLFTEEEWPRIAYFLDKIVNEGNGYSPGPIGWREFRECDWFWSYHEWAELPPGYHPGVNPPDHPEPGQPGDYYYCHEEAGDYPKKISFGGSNYVFCGPCWKEFYSRSDELLNDLQSYVRQREDERNRKKEVSKQMALPKPPQGATTTTQERSTAIEEFGEFLKVANVTKMLDDDGFVVCEIADRPPNLKAKNDGVSGPAEGRFGIDLPLTTPEGKAILTVRTNTQNYGDLFSAFGPEESDWIGQRVRISVQESQWSGRDFVKVEPVQ